MELTELAPLLGLDPDSTEEHVKDRIAELVAAPEPPVASKAVLDLLDLGPDASDADARGRIVALKNPDGCVPREEYDALRQQLAERDARSLVDQAIAACKVSPSQRGWALEYAQRDPEGFGAFVESAPKLLGDRPEVPGPEDRAPAGLTDDDLYVCELFNTDPKEFAACKAQLSGQ